MTGCHERPSFDPLSGDGGSALNLMVRIALSVDNVTVNRLTS